MFLTREEESVLNGEHGPGPQYAMEVLFKFGTAVNAEKMVPITASHASYTARFIAREPGIKWLNELAATGAKTRVPLTSQCTEFDLERWKELEVNNDIYEQQMELCRAHLKIGSSATWTCTPYMVGNIPVAHSHMTSVESSAIPYYNSILGVWTNREVGQSALLSAIVGRTPFYGNHLRENRKGTHLIKVETPLEHEYEYSCLGFFTGVRVGLQIPVYDGLRFSKLSQIRTLCAAGATSGGISVFHVPGVTADARTMAEAFQGDKPIEVISFTKDDLKETQECLSTASAEGDDIEFVDLGCPHYSVSDLQYVARLIEGKKVKSDVYFTVWTSGAARSVAERTGILNTIEAAGGHVYCDACPVQNHGPRFFGKVFCTNSAKQAGYAEDLLGAKCYLGSIENCVNAAIGGKWKV